MPWIKNNLTAIYSQILDLRIFGEDSK